MKTIQEQAIESMVPDLFKNYFFCEPTNVVFNKKSKQLFIESNATGDAVFDFSLNFDKKKNEIISEGQGARYRDLFEAFCTELGQEIKGIQVVHLSGTR